MRINIKKITERIEAVYGSSDLCSLLLDYSETAERAVGNKIRYPDFFERVRKAVTPAKLTSPDKIAEAISDDKDDFTFSELSFFKEYATIHALMGLDMPFYSDKELCDTVVYLKALNQIETDEIFLLLSNAEAILSESIYFKNADEKTKNLCRDAVIRYSKEHSIRESEAAEILTKGDILSVKPSAVRFLYFPVIFLLTALFFVGTAVLLGKHMPLAFLLVFPLSELSKEVADTVFSRIVKNRPIPKLKLKNVPKEGKTLTVITSLLSSEKDADSLFDRISSCYFSNRGKNINFGLLCDFKEYDAPVSPDDEKLTVYLKNKIDKLNEKYGASIFLFTRSRHYHRTENRYMGRERKRGAVIELTRLLHGKDTSITSYCSDEKILAGTKYVITLDSDTHLYNGAVKDMVGAMLHPSNRPVIKDGIVKKGYAIMQPRMEASLESAEKTPFAVLSSGNGGTDIYASAAYEAYQSIFGEGIFCGKGIFDADVFYELIDGKFPDEAILSHDLLEGTRLRAAALTDISLTDNLPKNPLSCFDRQHRWIRGDIQSLPFALRRVQNRDGGYMKNPISVLSRYKIFDNLRRALVPTAASISVIFCIFLPESIADITFITAISHLIFPCIMSIIFLIGKSGRRFFSYVLPSVLNSVCSFFYSIASLLYNGISSADAVIRAGFRMLFSRKHMLEWKTASDSEKGIKGIGLYIFKMLPSMLIGLAIAVFCPAPPLKITGLLFFAFPFAAYLIGKEFKEKNGISEHQKNQITEYARDIWGFFSDNVTKSENHLPPDNIQLSPTEVTAHRTSPTNIGLYLLSAVSAYDFAFISLGELCTRIRDTLTSIDKMQKYCGHLYNWYSTSSLDIIGSPYVSTVDSGNFITCLVALKEALTELDDGTPKFEELIERIEKLISETDFSVLYDEKKKLFKLGVNTSGDDCGDNCYDIFMSEARTTSYFAIASGQVPREHWRQLSRPLISRDGYIGLSSWSGTMFEYLMPTLLLPTRFGSLSYEALSFAVREQRKSTVNGLWGISESGYFAFDSDMNYQYKAFGVSTLGMKRGLEKECVLSPYSSFLALSVDPDKALENLKNLKDSDMTGKYGFYEAVDLTKDRVGRRHAIIRSYMSHHLGMSMIASANACNDGIFTKRFMSDPHMASSSELLEEKIPINAPISRHMRKRRHIEQPRSVRELFPSFEKPELDKTAEKPYASFISESGLTAVCVSDMIKLSSGNIDITLSPFVFGRKHRPRLLFSADGKMYDALSGGASRGVSGGCLTFTKDEKELMSKVTVSLSGKHRVFALSLDVRGDFKEICPMLTFEPSLAPSQERRSHPAYSDIMVSGEFLENENMVLYRRNGKKAGESDTFAAVSLEGGGHPSYLLCRDSLGTMYGDSDVEALINKELSSPSGALINPYLSIKRSSVSKGGKFSCDILISVGKSKEEAISSIISARKEIRSHRRKSAAEVFSPSLAKSNAEKISVCRSERGLERITELMLTRAVLEKNSEKSALSYHIGELWRHGISGDLPIITLDIKCEPHDGCPVSRLISGFISAHKYLSLMGIRTDLAVIYRSNGDYGGSILAHLRSLCDKASTGFLIGHSGGIHLTDGDGGAIKTASVIYAVLDGKTTLDSIISEHIKPLENDSIIVRQDVSQRKTDAENSLEVFGGCFTKKGFSVDKSNVSLPWSYVYALGNFGTLVTQNSLGYTWIGNSHERRITPYNCDNLLDFSGERLILNEEDQKYDLVACAENVFYKRGAAVYSGKINNKDYKITVTIDTKLPCKLILLDISDESEVEYTVDAVMGEASRASRPIISVKVGNITKFVPAIYSDDKYDVGFKIDMKFENGKRGYILGAYPLGGEAVLDTILKRYNTAEDFMIAETEYEQYIAALLPSFSLKCDDPYLSEITNYYLPYQTLVCRFFARTGFYQSGGAFGFRDQLQDCLAIMKGAPDIARVHILRSASHQYEEGDVMHWWHTVRGVSKGVRTRYSDDLLWLPYVTAEYVKLSGDSDILKIPLPYLTSPPLDDETEDRYEIPQKSKFKESLYSHCIRAIERSLTFGRHGLPLMGGGDWNDGMNYVGKDGGESVWLGFFIIDVLEGFLPLCRIMGDTSGASKYRKVINELELACSDAFSNGRFDRAYFSDGSSLGGDDAVDILPQAFAAITDADSEKVISGLKATASRLFDRDNRILKLLDPPFTRTNENNVGYISSYPVGIRENGGQYTHAAVWFAIGCASAGMNALSAEILKTVNPASISSVKENAERYKGEPYFLAGDVSSNPACVGRCGWSLYTGASGWFYTAVTEHLMGFEFFDDCFSVTPNLSEEFPRFTAKFTVKDTDYTVTAELGANNSYLLDGKYVNNLFYFDKNFHLLEITVEKNQDLL